MMYDFLATIGLIVCVGVGVVLLAMLVMWCEFQLAKRQWLWATREARRRYPVAPGYVDIEAEAAAAEVGYFSVRDHVLNVNRLREVDHDRAA